MRKLYQNIKEDPEDYRGKQVSTLLEEMIQENTESLLEDFSKEWCVKEDELAYVVANFNPAKEYQIGEKELKHTSDYEAYKENTENPVRKLSYWKNAYTDMVKEDILPL